MREDQDDVAADDQRDLQRHQDRRLDERADVLQIGEGAVDSGRWRRVVKREADALDLVIHGLADVVDHRHRKPHVGGFAEVAEDGVDQSEAGEDEDDAAQVTVRFPSRLVIQRPEAGGFVRLA